MTTQHLFSSSTGQQHQLDMQHKSQQHLGSVRPSRDASHACSGSGRGRVCLPSLHHRQRTQQAPALPSAGASCSSSSSSYGGSSSYGSSSSLIPAPLTLHQASGGQRHLGRRQGSAAFRSSAYGSGTDGGSAGIAPLRSLAQGEPLLTLQESLSFGEWRVRRIRDIEVPAVAAIQGESFAEPLPVPLIGDVQRQAFKAEVLDILRRKLNNCSEDRFACLVVERRDGDGDRPLGVVELTLEDDARTLREIGRDAPYAYVSCMAVLPSERRKGLATVLLQAAERLAGRWLERAVYLHVYEDNDAAVQLYRARGYRQLGSDPGWKRLLPGARVRLLMEKLL